MNHVDFGASNLIRARGREWVVLPKSKGENLWVRPLGGTEDDATLIYLPLEIEAPSSATFPYPDAQRTSDQSSALLLRDSLLLNLRSGAGPFRSFGNLTVQPRAYQLVPLLMALKQEVVRLLIADDVGIGKTIEAGLIARELLDRGEITRLSVICPPHLCDQWQDELAQKFGITADIVRSGTASRLERGLPPNVSLFDVYPFTIVSLDYIKMQRRRDEFIRACPEFVIIEEAHSTVGAGGLQSQRLELMSALASDPNRHMLFLTATPHSGDDTAFHNLLGLLDPDFRHLQTLGDGQQRRDLRERLALHFVQRRREDIKEWRDEDSVFPDREVGSDATYQLTGEWADLFDGVLNYAKTIVARTENESLLKQRMSWWAALALLRCVSSSPATAAMALSNRLASEEGSSDAEQAAAVDRIGMITVLDGESSDSLTVDDAVPAGQTLEADESEDDKRIILRLREKAQSLKGVDKDPKLKLLVTQIKKLVADSFRPVIFCRYIATAHYVADELKKLFPERNYLITAITGEMTPEDRRAKIESLNETLGDRLPILVATDCLSEGINLQSVFSAVVHYDLSWNPTRHEQRDGRVDRFGQPAKVVRTLMIYGANNPVDGAVLKVITDKAERIRKELGVAVPVPMDTNKVTEAILKIVLFQSGIAEGLKQGSLDFGTIEHDVDIAWESAKEKAKQNRTIFAQNTLRPEQVLPEWEKALSALGSEEDVARFVRTACERLGAPIEGIGSERYRLPLENLPFAVKDRLESLRIKPRRMNFVFNHPAPSGYEVIHRTHPLVSVLADYVVERALDDEGKEFARCGAVVTKDVNKRTTIYLMRLRALIGIDRTEVGGRRTRLKTLLAEEAIGIAVSGHEITSVLDGSEALSLMSAQPARNMVAEEKTFEVSDSLHSYDALLPHIESLAQARADRLLEDHMRVRDAARQRGFAYSVQTCLPADMIGCFVLVPA